jgi:hypothetical protein
MAELRCCICSQMTGIHNRDVPAICPSCLQAWDRHNQRLGLEAGDAMEAIAWAARRTRRLQAEPMRQQAMRKLMQELERKRIHMQSREAAPHLPAEEHGSNPLRDHPHLDPPSDGGAEG